MVRSPSRTEKSISLYKETTKSSLSFKIAPSAASACKARLAASTFIEEYFPHSDAAGEFMLAVGEALANAIEHGISAKEIRVSIKIRASVVMVTIEDDGCGFLVENMRSGKLPKLEAERGRGLPIIFYYTDSFTIDSRPNTGTRVALCRDLRKSDAA